MVVGAPLYDWHMDELLGEALRLVRRAYAEARAGAVGVSSDELVGLVADAQRVASAAGAVQGVRMAQFAARGQVQDRESGGFVERDFGVGHVHEFAGAEVGPALGLSPGSADRRVEVAAVWARKLPATLAAMAAGVFDPWRATVVADELRDATPEVCAQVEDLVFPDITGDTPGAARARVRRALAAVDPDAVRAKAAKAKLERGVRTWASHLPGMTEWAATLPAADSATCWAAIDQLARQRHRDDPTTSVEACRADALVDLLLGHARVEATVTVLLPIQPTIDTTETGDLRTDRDDSGLAATADVEDAETGPDGVLAWIEDMDRYDGDQDDAGVTDDEWAAAAAARVPGEPELADVIALYPELVTRPMSLADQHDAGLIDDLAGDHLRAEPATWCGCEHGDGPEHGYHELGPAAIMSCPPDTRKVTKTSRDAGVPFGLSGAAPSPASAGATGSGREGGAAPPNLTPELVGGCTIPGIGLIPAAVVTDLATRFDTTLARALIDAATGTVIETSAPAYRPPATIAGHVRLRDQTCRFPGCTHPATSCDLDHVVHWPHGPTAAHNLHALCRHHHRAKHETGWRLTMTETGVCTWTDPGGRNYTTYPTDHRQLPA